MVAAVLVSAKENVMNPNSSSLKLIKERWWSEFCGMGYARSADAAESSVSVTLPMLLQLACGCLRAKILIMAPLEHQRSKQLTLFSQLRRPMQCPEHYSVFLWPLDAA